MPRHAIIAFVCVIVFTTSAVSPARPAVCDRLIAALIPRDAKLKTLAAKWAEKAVNFITRNRSHQDKTVTLGAGDTHVSFKVEKRIGAGFFGVVYHVSIADYGSEAARAHPDLFEEGKPRSDLVIKFPQDISFPLLDRPFKRALEKEYKESSDLNAKLKALGFDPIAGTEVLAAHAGGRGKDDPPFLIKRLLRNICNTKTIAKTTGDLSPRQVEALKKIFDRAAALYKEYEVTLDLKPENLNWNDETGEWEMYEVSDQPMAGATFVEGGFEGYLAQVRANIASYR